MATAAINPSWSFDPEKHLYTDESGLLVPSVTQVIKAEGLISFDGVPPAVLEHKRQLGSLVHSLTELYDKGENLNDYVVPEECWPYVEGWINFRADSRFTPTLVEHQTVANMNGMRYGMKLDAAGEFEGRIYVIERKCGASEHPAWGVQIAAYVCGSTSPDQRSEVGRMAVQLGPSFTRKYKTFTYTDPADYQIWQCALVTTIWKQNKKIWTLEGVPERLEA